MNYSLVATKSIHAQVALKPPPQNAARPSALGHQKAKPLGVGAPGSGYALVGLVNQARISAQRPEVVQAPSLHAATDALPRDKKMYGNLAAAPSKG